MRTFWNWEEMFLAKFPAFNPEWTDEVQAKWVDTFTELMKMRRQVSPIQPTDEPAEGE